MKFKLGRNPEKISPGRAFAAIAQACVTDLERNVDRARINASAEHIHRLRVSIRRLCAARSIFHDLTISKGRINDNLHALQRKLSAVREWDVLIEDTIDSMPKRLSHSPSARMLIEAAESERKRARGRARASLSGKRCADILRLLEAGVGRVADAGARTRGDKPKIPGTSLARFAADTLTFRHKKAEKLGKKIHKLDQAELHKLRIRIKNLRYAVGFFLGIWPQRPTRKYLDQLKDLQGALGKVHDGAVAIELIGHLIAKGELGKDFDRAPICHRIDKHSRQDRKNADRLWRRLEKLKPFWT